MQNIKIIAEIANAHQGDEQLLLELVKSAAESGADGIKFQWFKYDHIAVPEYEFYPVYKELFIPEPAWRSALELAETFNLETWIDVFDDWGLELAKRYNSRVTGYKIPSAVIQSDTLVREIVALQKFVLLGIGGWYESEIDNFFTRFNKEDIKRTILMHGYQGYPTKTEDANLMRIKYLQNRYGFPVGFADHVDASSLLAIDLPVYAMFAGAHLIEKHLILDRSKKGYDYYSALQPQEFSLMVSKLRTSVPAIGSLQINDRERLYLKDSLRVIANQRISKGEIITESKISYKRCSHHKSLLPWEYNQRNPVVAKEEIPVNQPLLPEILEKPRVTVAVICRLKSTRLPKKALLPIHGIPSVKRCLYNCLAVPNVGQVVLATSWLPEDDPLTQYTLGGRVKIIRGDPENVASRLLQAAQETEANIVVRVTGDCPAVSPEILDILIKEHLRTGPDLTIPSPEHAAGTAGDIYTTASLEKLLNQDQPLTHTEYLSFYFVNNPEIFSVQKVELPDYFKIPAWRLTLDEQDDLRLLEKIYSDMNISTEPLFFSALGNYLKVNPDLAQVNSHVSLKWRDDQIFANKLLKATTLSSENGQECCGC